MNALEQLLVDTGSECMAIVVAVLCRMVRPRQRAADLAADAVSFAHVQALSQRPDIRCREHCRNWVVMVARRHAIQILRSEGRRREILEQMHADAQAGDARFVRAPPPFGEFAAEIADLLALLCEEDRRLIELRYFHGLTLEELCEECALGSITTAHKRLRRILGQLRKLLE